MAIAIGIWSLELSPGKLETVKPEADIRITNVSFGEIKDESSRGVVKFTYRVPGGADEDEDEDEDTSRASKTTVLCSLRPGTFEQTSTDIILQEDEEFIFEVVGKNVVYLTGNYMDQGSNNPPFGDTDDELSEDEDAHDLSDVSSEVEMHLDDLESDSGRFEEVQEEVQTEIQTKAQKRLRESELEPDTAKPMATQKKKKKQKGENGQVIEVLGEEKETKKKEQPSKKEDKNAESKKTKGIEREIAGGIKIMDAKIGTGPAAKKGNTVRMRYIGKLQDGHVFDKNTRGKPFAFHLGKGEVIDGWDEGIVGMQVGGERKLTIPPAMAYGNKSVNDIPKNSTLIFEVKLLEIK